MNSKLLGLALAIIAGIGLVIAPFALAQEETSAADGIQTEGITIGLIIKGGGTIGWVIIACSVVLLAFTLEDAYIYRRDKLIPPDLLNELEVLFEDQEYQEALELCEANPSLLTNIVGAALSKLAQGYDAMKEALAGTADTEAVKMQQKIGWLSLLANLSPMLGLFGTVQGMIATFQVIATSSGPPEPKAMAGSIQLALITTFLGLFVAMPGTCVYFFFRNKSVTMLMEAQGIADEFVERFRPTEG